jgi:Leucine-rich repeat (LRR) protein
MQRMKGLQLLSASQNTLKSLPLGLFDLSKSLTHLVLNDNKLTTVLEGLGNLAKLETLHLQNNPIKTVASSLYRLRALRSFGLDWF